MCSTRVSSPIPNNLGHMSGGSADATTSCPSRQLRCCTHTFRIAARVRSIASASRCSKSHITYLDLVGSSKCTLLELPACARACNAAGTLQYYPLVDNCTFNDCVPRGPSPVHGGIYVGNDYLPEMRLRRHRGVDQPAEDADPPGRCARMARP